MAYGTRYIGQYSNEIQVLFTVDIKQKDYVGDPDTFIVQDLELSDSIDDGCIIAREARLDIRCEIGSAIDWETFLTGNYDEWYVEVYDETYCHFEGFLTPEEGNAPFLDKPYSITIRASNALKLLKDAPLTKLDGSNFQGKFTLSDYLVAALAKTMISIPVRVYGSIYTSIMNNRDGDPAATHWNQAKLDARTFLDDATTFISCYEALVRLLGRSHRLYYFNRMWIVFFTHEHQYAPGGLWYTDFDAAGAVIGGGEDTTGYATVGKAEAIFPINADALISSSFPIKFAKTSFKYEVYPEFPLNNKFERGTFIAFGQQPDELDEDGDNNRTELTLNTFKTYTVEDWTSGTYQGNPTEYANLPTITVGNPDPWYRRSIYNGFGVEVQRDLVIERHTAAGGRFVQSSGEPVNQGDKIRFNFDWRTDTDLDEADPVPVQITPYVVDDITGDKWVLRSKNGQYSEAKWEPSGSQMIGIYITPNSELRQYQNISIESPAFPVNGTLYFMLWSSAQLGDNTKTYFKGFSVEYIPYIAGSYVPITGDYWVQSQTAGQIDKDEGEVGISDAPIRVLQGCLFNSDGITATELTWYRYGVQESRHYKEIVNWARYNLGRRRYWQLDGSFKGIYYEASNDLTALAPISYHKNYRLQDPAQPRDMILVPPLTIDLCKGHIKAIFEEVINPALSTNYGADMYRVINGLINQVAVVHGLVLERYPPDRRMMRLTSALGTTITSSANDGGAGNTPVLTVNTQSDLVSFHEAILTIGEDIEIGNTFTISVDGTPATYTVIDIIEQSDGTQPGDSSSFNYIFSKT